MIIEVKRRATEEDKERAKRERQRERREGEWNHGSGREDTWRPYERERPQPGPSGLH